MESQQYNFSKKHHKAVRIELLNKTITNTGNTDTSTDSYLATLRQNLIDDTWRDFERWQELHSRKKLTKSEQEECKRLDTEITTIVSFATGQIALSSCDQDNKDMMRRFHEELVAEYGNNTATKKMLIDRLVSAYIASISYERLLQATKYITRGSKPVLLPLHKEHTQLIAEARRGMESANGQILKLTEALQNITKPPMHVHAAQVFFAQHQQVNQGFSPRDLDNTSHGSK